MPVLLVYARTASTNTTLKNVLITTEHLTKSYFHVYQLTDPQDPSQAPFFKDCDVGPKWGFLICILRARRGYVYRYIYDKKIITFDRFHEFLEKYTNHKLEPAFKNELIKEPYTGKVMNLNQETFSKLMDLTKPG